MKNSNILYGVIGLVVGTLVMGSFCSFGHNQEMDMDHKSNAEHIMMGTMEESMTQSLSKKTGDEFDKAFIKEMIAHHQGAIVMSQLAKINAKHEEIKTLADVIISSQTEEIIKMQNWLNDWYKN